MSIALSFDDCPYKCSNGRLMDYNTHNFVDCPHCSEKKKELLDQGVAVEEFSGDLVPLSSILGVDSQYLSTKFFYESLIPDGERIFLEEDSLERQETVLSDIYAGLSIGQLPSRSYCVGLGNKGKIDMLAYPFLAKAYLSGVSVARFISCCEYNRMCIRMDDVSEFIDRDFVLVLIPDGASKADIASAKGLMQERALKNRATIFITTWVIEACSILMGYYGDETKFLASSLFVCYKRGKGKQPSNYINQLTGVENEVYSSESPKSKDVNKNYVTMDSLMKI